MLDFPTYNRDPEPTVHYFAVNSLTNISYNVALQAEVQNSQETKLFSTIKLSLLILLEFNYSLFCIVVIWQIT